MQGHASQKIHSLEPCGWKGGDGQCVVVKPNSELEYNIRQRVNAIFARVPKAPLPFPKPIGLTRHELKTFQPKSTLVTEKLDGQRYWLYFGLVQRKYEVACLIDTRYHIQLVKFKVDPPVYEDTLLDGELIKHDNCPWVYHIFDAYKICGIPIHKQKRLSDRMKKVTALLPFLRPSETTPFQLSLKKYYCLATISNPILFLTTICSTPGLDGLIFNVDTYVADEKEDDPVVFKWKMYRDITIDCIVTIVEGQVLFYVMSKDTLGEPFYVFPMEQVFAPCPNDHNDHSDHNDHMGPTPEYACRPCMRAQDMTDCPIVECFYCCHHRVWKPLRIRPDRLYPNSKSVALSTVQLITDYISIAELSKVMSTQEPEGEKEKKETHETHG
jgi:hypothetical protein